MRCEPQEPPLDNLVERSMQALRQRQQDVGAGQTGQTTLRTQPTEKETEAPEDTTFYQE